MRIPISHSYFRAQLSEWTGWTRARTATRLFFLLLAYVLLTPNAALALTEARTVHVIGVQSGLTPKQEAFVSRTADELNAVSTEHIYVLKHFSSNERFDVNTYADFDYAVVSPQVYALLERFNGFTPLASLAVPANEAAGWQQPSSEHSALSAVVFADPDLTSGRLPLLEDIVGEIVAPMRGDVCDAGFLLQNELKLRRLPYVILQEVPEADSPEEMVTAARAGGIKAFVVTTDYLREANPKVFEGLVKVDLRHDDETGLDASVTPMPGWVFAAGLTVPRDSIKDFAATLLSVNASPVMRWAPPADYRSVHQAAERVRDPAYVSFQRRTFKEFVFEHVAWFLVGLVILVGLIWHSIAAERLVRRRTDELMETVQKHREAEQQFEELERMTVVSQMSNIVAHELRQPLAAVTNFAMGLKRRIANGTLTNESLDFALGRILSENERASDIVEHVRDYAKRRTRQKMSIDLHALADKLASGVRLAAPNVHLTVDVPTGLCVEGDTLEVELILRNLLKNAVESVDNEPDACVRLMARREVRKDMKADVTLVVEDNGPIATREALEKLAVPLRSEKSGGLGLGLSIVRRIVEANDGRLGFELASPNGLKVRVTLPAQSEASEASEEAENEEVHHG